MLTTEDGSFVKANIDLYKQSGGKPTAEEISQQIQSTAERADIIKDTGEFSEKTAAELEASKNERDPTTGLTYGELEEMDFQEILELIKKKMGKEIDF
jgi:hypothetical protein